MNGNEWKCGLKINQNQSKYVKISPVGSMPCSSAITSQNLAPIWFPHWPPWTCTSSRMASEGSLVTKKGTDCLDTLRAWARRMKRLAKVCKWQRSSAGMFWYKEDTNHEWFVSNQNDSSPYDETFDMSLSWDRTNGEEQYSSDQWSIAMNLLSEPPPQHCRREAWIKTVTSFFHLRLVLDNTKRAWCSLFLKVQLTSVWYWKFCNWP